MQTKQSSSALIKVVIYLNGGSLKLVDKVTYTGSSVSSVENNIYRRHGQLSICYGCLAYPIKSNAFFQSILHYGCTIWTLTKRNEKKFDGNCTKMLRFILNKSWTQHPTKQLLYGHPPPISKTIQIRRTRHARHCWR